MIHKSCLTNTNTGIRLTLGRACWAIFLAVAISAQSWAASSEKARLLYDAMLFEDAKRELVAVVTSDAQPEEKAEALHLLGRIAVDEKRYDAALRFWSDLIAQFPETEDAEQVSEKIPLVRALAATDASAEKQTPAPSAPQAGSGLRGVVVAGAGTEAQFVSLAVDEISNYLTGSGVESSKAPGQGASLTDLMPLAREASADSVLVLTLKFGYLESLRAECYLVDGGLLWEEKASGSFGFTKSGVAAGLIDRMKSKLERRIGDPCLKRKG